MPRPTETPADEVPLLGQPGSWDGFGSKPLGIVPDKVLKRALGWFGQKVREQQPMESRARLRHQIDSIKAVLAFREANSPQTTLF